MAEYQLTDSKGKVIRGYVSTQGRTILEILRDELCYHESADGEYENVPGLQYAINVITSPYSYPERSK